jgi:hypothetical protein
MEDNKMGKHSIENAEKNANIQTGIKIGAGLGVAGGASWLGKEAATNYHDNKLLRKQNGLQSRKSALETELFGLGKYKNRKEIRSINCEIDDCRNRLWRKK